MDLEENVNFEEPQFVDISPIPTTSKEQRAHMKYGSCHMSMVHR